MGSTDQLSTKVSVPAFHPKIQYQDRIFMVGSCFTEHISYKLLRYKYDVVTNPFGILYNPVSMAMSMERIINLRFYDVVELVLHDGLYHSMDHHGSFSGKDTEVVIQKINTSLQQAHDHLKNSAYIFISPGTSKVYTYKPTGGIVGNCHKIPQTSFEHAPLTVFQCEEAFGKTYDFIKQVSPKAKIIWTVSPVRHIRDGLIENQRSKSTLLVALDQHIQHHSGSSYFPAYEIMMDQLRDYRYYARDLIHPSDVAVDIIWDVFCDIYLDPHQRDYHVPMEKIKKSMEHRWLHDDQDAIKLFARGQLKNVDHMATLLPDLNWHEERKHFFEFLDMD